MKIGIITFHCSYNFGSALQAWALQKILIGMGHDVSIIDYRSRDFNFYHVIRPLRPWTIPHSLAQLSSILRRRKAFQAFWKEELRLTRETYSYRNEGRMAELENSFDAFVCGSDQIWNLDCTNGVVAPFFLSFAGKKRRIAYAPSLAHTSFRESVFNRELVSGLLGQFDSLSIREKETLPLFQSLVDKKIEVVADPTLLNDAAAYKRLASNKLIDEPYVFVYLLRECPELNESAKMLAQQGKNIFYVSERKLDIPGSRNLFGIGPKEFLSLILHADLVLANSFHATVFSVLFHKRFKTFLTDKSASRMRDFLGELDLEACCSTSVCTEFNGQLDWERVDKAISEIRSDSLRYLEGALAS